MRGNHTIAEAAVRAGCRFYAGYPITPQNEFTEYAASAMAKLPDGVFIQAESEIAAMVTPGAALQAQWPQWGGPNRNFQIDTQGLADSWPDDGARTIVR